MMMVASASPGRRRARRYRQLDVFAAIGDPIRRDLLDALRAGEQPVHELSSRFAVTRSAISQHLQVLKDVHLVDEVPRGRERRYRLQSDGLRELFDWIKQYESFWTERLSRLGAVLDDEAARQSARPRGRGTKTR